jgi:hypothetical protein
MPRIIAWELVNNQWGHSTSDSNIAMHGTIREDQKFVILELWCVVVYSTVVGARKQTSKQAVQVPIYFLIAISNWWTKNCLFVTRVLCQKFPETRHQLIPSCHGLLRRHKTHNSGTYQAKAHNVHSNILYWHKKASWKVEVFYNIQIKSEAITISNIQVHTTKCGWHPYQPSCPKKQTL